MIFEHQNLLVGPIWRCFGWKITTAGQIWGSLPAISNIWVPCKTQTLKMPQKYFNNNNIENLNFLAVFEAFLLGKEMLEWYIPQNPISGTTLKSFMCNFYSNLKGSKLQKIWKDQLKKKCSTVWIYTNIIRLGIFKIYDTISSKPIKVLRFCDEPTNKVMPILGIV